MYINNNAILAHHALPYWELLGEWGEQWTGSVWPAAQKGTAGRGQAAPDTLCIVAVGLEDQRLSSQQQRLDLNLSYPLPNIHNVG